MVLYEDIRNWTSGNEIIDDFIREMQLKFDYHDYHSSLFEWIPYNQFNGIKEIGKNGCSTVCSAIWKDGPLCYNENNYAYNNKWMRNSNKKVALKWLYKLQNINEFLNRV